MCTYCWLSSPGEYHVFFNRDERHTRGVETPPAEGQTDGVRWLAPRDPDAGGTWIAANEAGVTVALLNDYSEGLPPGPGPRSRGLLVLACAGARDLSEVETVLSAPLADYASFHLLAAALPASGEAVARHWRWDGRALRSQALTGPEPGLVVSSAYCQEEVLAWRADRLAALSGPDGGSPRPEQVRQWQRGHDPAWPAHSPSMWRHDAATRSYAHIRVTVSRVEMGYEAVRPVPGPEVCQTLARTPPPKGLPVE